MDVYAENILDHYRHPRNKLIADSCQLSACSHTEENLSCGDTVTVHLAIENDRITKVSWDGTGCAISQAAMSMLSEELVGKSLDEVKELMPKSIYDMLGVPIGPRRVKCALLSLHTLKNALNVYRKEALQGWNETIAE